MPKTVTLGTILRVETDTPGEYIAVGNLTSISVPGPVKTVIDVTDLDSVAMEKLVGLPDNGEMTMAGFLNLGNAGQALLLADANDPDAPKRGWQVEFTRQGWEFIFQGWTLSFVPAAGGPNEAYTFDASVVVDGAVTPAELS